MSADIPSRIPTATLPLGQPAKNTDAPAISRADQTSDIMPRPVPATQAARLASILTQTRARDQSDGGDADLAIRREMARINSCLQKAIEQRTMELRAMIAELDEVSYALVHDMRAPLRAMRGFAEMLNDGAEEILPEEKKEYIRRIISASNRLDKLIEDALTYNRAVLRILPLQAVDLGRLVQDIIDTYPVLKLKDAEIGVEGDLPIVLGNEALLTQCLSNLLDNAVKFVAPDVRPCVRIRAECTSECARIWIEDNGIGIPRLAQRRLFGLFQKLNADYEGTGLGLAIVRKVVERMNGRFGVESEPGRGSRFWVEFKRATAF
jgi:signal transduction histidine kinase